MPEYFIVILALAAVAFFVYWVRFRKPHSTPTIEDRVFAITDKQTSPFGVSIWIEKGASITRPEMTAIENGLTRCFEKSRLVGYDKPFNLSDYKVAIMAGSMRAPESHTWCYKLPAGPYAGTEWDLGGYILAAGQMITAGEPYGNIIAIPDHHGTDLEQLALIAEYEAEHIILAFCDGDKFEATKIHGVGQGHPLIP